MPITAHIQPLCIASTTLYTTDNWGLSLLSIPMMSAMMSELKENSPPSPQDTAFPLK